MVVVWQRLCDGDGGGGAPAVKVTMVSELWMWLAVGRRLVAGKLGKKKGGGGAKVEGDGVDVMLELVGVATAYLSEKIFRWSKKSWGRLKIMREVRREC
ncbi:hypothetical protein Tco_0274500 [Tanacetum coccineum]